MSTYHITAPGQLQASITLPASKSISNRALIICALTGCHDQLQNLSNCDDTDVIIKALRDMPPVIDIKAAGTAMRFMAAYLSATESGTHLLTGTERMQHRPIKVLVDALRLLGADIEYAGEEGFPPLRINGHRLQGGEITVDGGISSQFISALLLIGPLLKGGLKVCMQGDIVSRPYIDLTLWTMSEFGADATWTGVGEITVRPKSYVPRAYIIENDWSAASYWYEMMALTPDSEACVELTGLMDGSKQGDSGVRYLFSLLGVKTTFATREPGVPTTVILRKSSHRVPRLEYDFSGAPDLAQTFVVCCALMGVHFHFEGLQTLQIKETNRIEALKREMRKLGYVVHDTDGHILWWDGERCDPQQEPIDTYDDHRMALAFAPASLVAPIDIRHPEVVTKSYPNYWGDLRTAGFRIEEKE